MKHTGFTLRLLWLLSLLVVGTASNVQANNDAQEITQAITQVITQATTPQAGSGMSPAGKVSYDKTEDLLSVSGDNISLKLLLAKIAKQSGIEVMFDDAAEETVSFDFETVSLEKGVKKILKGRNHIFNYAKNEQGKLLLVGVMVLPDGASDNGRARALLDVDDEAYNRALSELSLEQVQEMDRVNERWQARFEMMSPGKQEAIKKRVNDRLLKKARREQRHEEKRQARQKKSADAKAKRQKRRDAQLEHMSDEERTEYKQQGKVEREQMDAQLKTILQDGLH